MRTFSALALTILVAGTAAAAYDPIVISRGWERVDSFERDKCAGEVGTNGKYYVLSTRGFAPGERAYLTITNGDMQPIERAVQIDRRGRWQDYYLPFRYNRAGGVVEVTIAGETCVVPLSFAWRRATIGTSPRS